MKNKYSVPRVLAWIAVLFLSAACASPNITTATEEEKAEQIVSIDSIAVLPTEVPVVSDQKADDPALKNIKTGADVINDHLSDYFADNAKTEIISANQSEGLNTGTAGNRFRRAREIGAQLGYDAVLATTLTRYTPRDGGNFSAGAPASVAFDYKLMAVGSGQILCSGSFDETQKALFENLFSFATAAGRGFKWISAEELAREGLKKKLDSCVYLQTEGKSTK